MNTVEGIGTDIIEIERIEKAIIRHGARFLDRLFTQKEQSYCLSHKNSSSHFAGRFAAKEAISKAFGTGIGKEVEWTEIEILNQSHGQPEVMLSPQLNLLFPKVRIFLSISHCKEYATATAVLTRLS